MAAIDIAGVTKTFGSHVAVDDLSLSVADGSIYGFIGPNGSGKTTTLRMIMHILLPDRGEIEVLGSRDTRAADQNRGLVAIRHARLSGCRAVRSAGSGSVARAPRCAAGTRVSPPHARFCDR